jgi:hypothetical protein
MSEYLGGPYIYSTGGGLTCSICAPEYVSAEDIEAFAYRQLGATKDGNRWSVFDKSTLKFLQSTLATPHLCNHAPNRLHWFLIDATMAERWATAQARCRACGGEMVLINVIEDMSMPVVGLERRAYMCSACGITEQRTAINKQAKEKQKAEVNAILNPRPIVPTKSVDNHRASQGFLGRVLAIIRGHQKNSAKPSR